MNILRPSLSETALSLIPRSYDIVGDILITDLSSQTDMGKILIGNAYLDSMQKIRIVASLAGQCEGIYRTKPLQIIAGRGTLDTIHRENDVDLRVNPSTVYFSPRMGPERLRISQLINPGEKIAVLCSGIAPLPLVIAKNSEVDSIVGIEINPHAHALAKENLILNKMNHKITLICGDATNVPGQESLSCDRVVTMLPTDHNKLLISAIRMLRAGGILHHYAMVHRNNHSDIIAAILAKCAQAGRTAHNLEYHKCGHCAPRTYRFCFTANIG
ncbi:class I SAM-dependent methyltransferase [Desulfogranum japonicum]|uniref:class I SAM-dependent methyltransferase n=1 Tax=Desulfogranum japonicum TaxID=231447 RepID=UPI001378C665|nr:methyltransferase domain-containing protein [Desulfogranum japonicum]